MVLVVLAITISTDKLEVHGAHNEAAGVGNATEEKEEDEDKKTTMSISKFQLKFKTMEAVRMPHPFTIVGALSILAYVIFYAVGVGIFIILYSKSNNLSKF